MYQTTPKLSGGAMVVFHQVTSKSVRVVRWSGTVEANARYVNGNHCILSCWVNMFSPIFYPLNNFQKSEWKLHRLECSALSKLDKHRRKFVTPSIRLILKLYLRRKLELDKVNNFF